MSADWVRLAEEIANELRALSRDRKPDQSVRLSLGELLQRAGSSTEPDGYRSRSYWAQSQRGDPHWTAFRNAGLVLGFDPDERGKDVERVIFRLDRTRA